MKKLRLLSCLVTGEALRHAQSKQNCGLSLLNPQACCWELLLLLKAEFFFSLQPVVLVYLQLVNMTEACQN